MVIEAIKLVRERDFAQFVCDAPEEDLLRERTLIKQELQRLENFRTPITEILRDRLGMIERALGIATLAAA